MCSPLFVTVLCFQLSAHLFVHLGDSMGAALSLGRAGQGGVCLCHPQPLGSTGSTLSSVHGAAHCPYLFLPSSPHGHLKALGI